MKQVTAAIIERVDDDGQSWSQSQGQGQGQSWSQSQILICQRAADDECGMLWEFPGGKLEEGETLEECLQREIMEELNVEIEVGRIFMTNLYRYLDNEIFFTVFNAKIIGGEMRLNVHNAAKWISLEEIDEYEFMPADIKFVKKLKADLLN